jgi:16S rRNA processing protein RimM
MEVQSCYKIGWIFKPHGLKGEVTVMLEDDAPADLSTIDSVFLEQNNRLVPYFIEAVSGQGKKAFLKFEDVDSPEAAKLISKQSVYIPKSARPKNRRGKFYDDEVIDFQVFDAEMGLLGKIGDVIAAGPNRLLSLEHHGKEILIPTNAPFIKSINKSKKRIDVELPEGFLDI